MQDIVITKLDITATTYEEQQKWLVEVGNNLTKWNDIEDWSIMAQAEILYTVWSLWESDNNVDGLSLRNEAKSPWEYDYYKWAKSYSKKRALKEPAYETINNKITIYRDWIAEQTIEYPEVVFIPKRNEFGLLVDPNLDNDEAWEQVSFDPKKIDYGKLLVSRGSARKQKLSPEAWSTLADPYATVHDLKVAIKGDETLKTKDDKEDFSIYEEEGIIYGYSNGKSVAVLQAIFENSSDELFSKTLCHILTAAGLKVPLGYQNG